MNRPHVLDFGEQELTTPNVDAPVLDEDAWEEATDGSGVDCEMLCRSRWRSSTFDAVD